MAAGENEGQVVKPAPTGKVSILMIIVVVLIITVIVDRPLEVLESPLGYVPALPPRRCVREVKWMPWTSTASWAASEKRLYVRGFSMASGLVLVNEKVLWSVPKKSASAPHRTGNEVRDRGAIINEQIIPIQDIELNRAVYKFSLAATILLRLSFSPVTLAST